jgi:hypothetical protein
MIPPIHAVIVGIDEYLSDGVGELHTAVKDALKMEKSLKRLQSAAGDAPSESNSSDNIKVLTNKNATHDAIIEALRFENAERNDAIIFFFSGFSGQIEKDGETTGLICPTDVYEPEGGAIPDSFLRDLFNGIAKTCGNNIVSFSPCFL